jgi:lipid A 3-O-deacylase
VGLVAIGSSILAALATTTAHPWGGSRRSHAGRLALLVLLLLLLGAPAGAGESTPVAALGVIGVEGGEKRAAIFELEYRFPAWRFGIGPVIGAAGTTNGGTYERVGLGRDVPFAERWNAHFSLCGGAYQRGGGKDLGRGFEFRSAVDVSYRLRPDLRVGLVLAHLSNAGLSQQNPGVETLSVTVAFGPHGR